MLTTILILAFIIGLYLAWNIGANDVANAMGTSVGSGALTLKQAVIVAAIFEFAGAMLVGGNVTNTISKGIVDIHALGSDPVIIAVGMTCCLLASACWLNIATFFGWPVSTTHSIVGAVVGFGLLAGGLDAVHWDTMGKIVASWFISPLLGGMFGFVCFIGLQKLILKQGNPLIAVRRWGPFLVFPIFAILSLSMIFKGLKPLNLNLQMGFALPLAALVGALCALVSVPLIRKVTRQAQTMVYDESSKRAERVFLVLQVLTACYVAFAHGSNDVANAVGPLSAVYSVVKFGAVEATVDVPIHVLLIGALGIVIGLATYGHKVMKTVGKDIIALTPSLGFAAQFAAASTIMLASKLGLPVSTTHTLVGAVVGVGFAHSKKQVNGKILKNIAASWFITVPFTAALCCLFFLVARELI